MPTKTRVRLNGIHHSIGRKLLLLLLHNNKRRMFFLVTGKSFMIHPPENPFILIMNGKLPLGRDRLALAPTSSSTESSSGSASSRSLGSNTTTTTHDDKSIECLSAHPVFLCSTTTNNKRTKPLITTKPAARAYTPSARSYEYNHSTMTNDVDFSDALPLLDFKVKTVPDVFRESCPHCDLQFSLSKRRHHCRLCGDIFCDACSSHQVELPLEGKEFEAPVRICDFCHVDVNKGNFFSMRRYLTPLIVARTPPNNTTRGR